MTKWYIGVEIKSGALVWRFQLNCEAETLEQVGQQGVLASDLLEKLDMNWRVMHISRDPIAGFAPIDHARDEQLVQLGCHMMARLMNMELSTA